jgi:hypothetical protein
LKRAGEIEALLDDTAAHRRLGGFRSRHGPRVVLHESEFVNDTFGCMLLLLLLFLMYLTSLILMLIPIIAFSMFLYTDALLVVQSSGDDAQRWRLLRHFDLFNTFVRNDLCSDTHLYVCSFCREKQTN